MTKSRKLTIVHSHRGARGGGDTNYIKVQIYFFSVGQIGRYLASVWGTSVAFYGIIQEVFIYMRTRSPRAYGYTVYTCVYMHIHVCKTDWEKLGRKVVRNPFLKVTTASRKEIRTTEAIVLISLGQFTRVEPKSH